MNATITFDTLVYAKKLLRAGFTQEQAEIQAEALKDIIEEGLASKQDIRNLEQKLLDLEYRLTIRLGFMLATSIAIITAIIKLI